MKNNITVRWVRSIRKYIEEISLDPALEMQHLGLGEKDDSEGKVVSAVACDEQGNYEPQWDSRLVIADDWDGILSYSNNGWDWAVIYKTEVDAWLIRWMVRLDTSLDAGDVEECTKDVCGQLGVKYEEEER